MDMKGGIALLLMIACQQATPPAVMQPIANTDYIKTAEAILTEARYNRPTDSLAAVLANASWPALQAQLPNDAAKKAFWINLYNAYTIRLLRANPALYQNRNSFFSGRQIKIAGHSISLDDIEHGILRRNRSKWSMGYWGKWFPPAFTRQGQVDNLDFRIHFALNCGAKSCPPIAFYTPQLIDKQLQLAQKGFLQNFCLYNEAKNEVRVPKIFSWFRGDFEGKKGIMRLLKQAGIVPEGKNPSIHFLPYDWTLSLP